MSSFNFEEGLVLICFGDGLTPVCDYKMSVSRW